MIAPEAARGEQAARRLLAVACAREHRPGDRADRDRRRDARPGRPAEQERRQHDRAPRARVLAAHRREAEVEEELAGARLLQERAVDREQDDQRRRHVDRRAEDAFERLVHEARSGSRRRSRGAPTAPAATGRRSRTRGSTRRRSCMIQPDVRRHASSTSSTNATPKHDVGVRWAACCGPRNRRRPAAGRRSSRRRAAAHTTSHHIRRLR